MEKIKLFLIRHHKLCIFGAVFIIGMTGFPLKVQAQEAASEVGSKIIEDAAASEMNAKNTEGSLPLIITLVFSLFVILAVIQYWGQKIIE